MTKRHRGGRYILGSDPKKRKLHVGWWHRGQGSQIVASAINMKEKGAIANYVAKGWLPIRPILKKGMKVFVMGSCFAERLTMFLRHKSKIAVPGPVLKTKVSHRFPHTAGGMDLRHNVNLFIYGAGFQTSFANLHQLEWALGEREINNNAMLTKEGRELFGTPTYGKDSQSVARRALLESDVFILGYATSEIIYDKRTGYTHFGAIPFGYFNHDRMGFAVSSVEDNVVMMDRTYELIRSIKPNAPIVYYIAPVPLMSTFRPIACASANTVSKSILRVAIDEHMRKHENDSQMLYLPSYEIVDTYPGDAYAQDRRHLKSVVRNSIFNLINRYYIGVDDGK